MSIILIWSVFLRPLMSMAHIGKKTITFMRFHLEFLRSWWTMLRADSLLTATKFLSMMILSLKPEKLTQLKLEVLIQAA